MKPNTRLLIRLTFDDNSMKSWGYDYPHYKTDSILKTAIEADFQEMPDNTEIHLFYDSFDRIISADNNSELADNSVEWLYTTGKYNGFIG